MYMDYHDDVCMDHFTLEQVKRMRCVLDNWRTALPIRIAIFPGNFTGTPNNLAVATNVNGTTICDNETQTGRTDGAAETTAAYAGNPWVQAGDEVAYRIVHPGGPMKIKLFNLTSDLDLNLMPAAGTPASNIASSTNVSNNRERIIVPAAAAGTYYAVADTFAVSAHSVYGGNFTIRYSRCLADVDDDNAVNVTDLLAIISAWGACPVCDADINGDSNVNVTDLLSVISEWGSCP